MSNENLAITLSHELGTGGAAIGQKLSELLHLPFVDREILHRVSRQLHMNEEDLEKREERLSSFWQSFSRYAIYTDPAVVISGEYTPSDSELFTLESDCITQIARNSSVIVLGRGGRYILRDHPRHVSVFLHGDIEDRVKHMAGMLNISADAARKTVEANDKARGAYISTFTKQNWLDARLYDICINTSGTGVDTAVSLISECVKAKLKKLAAEASPAMR
jgi:cytidylate kinase